MAGQQQVVNTRTGKIERVYVDLEAVYPNPTDLREEYSFEELRARHRGWLRKSWKPAQQPQPVNRLLTVAKEREEDSPRENTAGIAENTTVDLSQQSSIIDIGGPDHTLSDITSTKDISKDGKGSRPRRKKVREIKGETQTSMVINRQAGYIANS